MKEKFELPPAAFTNRINDLKHSGDLRKSFDYRKWRKSPEWKIFVAGYNMCVEDCNAKIKSRYNIGQTQEKLFGI